MKNVMGWLILLILLFILICVIFTISAISCLIFSAILGKIAGVVGFGIGILLCISILLSFVLN